jgi:hypothetical protein
MIVVVPASAGLHNAFFVSAMNAMEYYPTGAYVRSSIFRISQNCLLLTTIWYTVG